jgi:predicted O-methyltransferase YrrM
MGKARIRDHEAFLADIQGRDWISDEVMWKWFRENHSVSKHMLILYSIVRGLNAKRVLEIGFGRSSLILARAAHENEGEFVCCDTSDCSDLLSESEKKITQFVCGTSDTIWKNKNPSRFDFAFLDYFSGVGVSLPFVIREVRNCLQRLSVGGILCIHDVAQPQYPVHRIEHYLKLDDAVEWLVLPYHHGLAVIRKKKERPGWISALRLRLFWWMCVAKLFLRRLYRFLRNRL